VVFSFVRRPVHSNIRGPFLICLGGKLVDG